MSVQSRWMQQVLAASAEATPTLPWQRGSRSLLRTLQRVAAPVEPTPAEASA